MIASNLKSVYRCIKAVMPHMMSQKRGDIINIVSQPARVPYPLGRPYAAAKHAAMALTETVGLQAATYGIRVNAVSPGLVGTPGQRRLMTLFIPEDQLPPLDPPASKGRVRCLMLRVLGLIGSQPQNFGQLCVVGCAPVLSHLGRRDPSRAQPSHPDPPPPIYPPTGRTTPQPP